MSKPGQRLLLAIVVLAVTCVLGGCGDPPELAPVSGTMPRSGNTQPKRAFSDAMRMSHCAVHSAPMPTAAPFTAAMVG